VRPDHPMIIDHQMLVDDLWSAVDETIRQMLATDNEHMTEMLHDQAKRWANAAAAFELARRTLLAMPDSEWSQALAVGFEAQNDQMMAELRQLLEDKEEEEK
jgi:hypothetical protein